MLASERLDLELAARLAELALESVRREYPNSPGHVLQGPGDTRGPRELHPAFYGCFDWHSAVHSHWLLVRLLRQAPGLPATGAIRTTLGEHLTAANLRAEAAYFAEPGRRGFERPYGWAWLLKLAAELRAWEGDPHGGEWAAAMTPLAETICGLYRDYLPRLSYPIRSGVHSNTAFGLAFALNYGATAGDEELRGLMVRRSLDYFGADRGAPAAWEPGGGDFLSPSLVEADLMRRVLPQGEFATWLEGFLPGLAQGEPAQLFTPAIVSDRSDGQIVHLDGLNLSRAWCMWGIVGALPPEDGRRAVLLRAAEEHALAGMAGVGSGEYMGDHWLGSFALYMLSCAPGRAGDGAATMLH